MTQGSFFKILLNTLRLRQNHRHFADDIFKCIFLNEDICISIDISLKFVPGGQINNPALVRIMSCRVFRANDGKFNDVYMRHSALMSLIHNTIFDVIF